MILLECLKLSSWKVAEKERKVKTMQFYSLREYLDYLRFWGKKGLNELKELLEANASN